jgi:cellulose synthase/poly-beta-1,6-N-acetylglucosamine synthase-like glycosyltransferase
MGGWGPVGLAGPLAGGPVPAATTDWFTLAVAVLFSVTGLILLLLGWISLPRAPNDPKGPRTTSSGMALSRVVGGAGLAVLGVAFAAYSIAHEGAWSASGLAGALWFLARVPWALGMLGLLATELARALLIKLGALVVGLVLAERAAGVGLLYLYPYHQYIPANLIVLGLTAILGGVAGGLSSSARWSTSGVLTFLGVEFLALGLVGFSLLAIESATSPIAQGLGLWLVGVEMFGIFLFVAYQYYSLEYLTGQTPGTSATNRPFDRRWTPSVLVQVACYNEPPAIVENSLRSVALLDYPKDRFHIQLLDDSTDPRTVARLRTFCEGLAIEYRHRTDRRGFKGGALNDGLRAADPPPDLVAIVDADYVVQPSFLKLGVQPFKEAKVGFVQTPQAYRNAVPGSLARWYALADAYFYRVVQPVRARAQSLIFCGTMGLVRAKALTAVGGWSETCVTEDAELSLRLLAEGWRGEYVPRTLGWGLAPNLLSSVRSQHRRWAFGGTQMLRMNREKLENAKLSLRQRVDFRMSALFWIDGLFLLGVTAALTSLVVGTWFGVTLSLDSTTALAIVAAAPLLLMLDGLMKIRIALRATTPVSAWDTIGILAFWYSIKLNDLRAALQGWRHQDMPFVRTPKERPKRPSRSEAFSGALRDSAFETSVATVVGSVDVYTAYRWGLFRPEGFPPTHLPSWTELLLLAWLGYYTFCFACALGFDYLSRRSASEAPTEKPVGAPSGRPPGRTGPAGVPPTGAPGVATSAPRPGPVVHPGPTAAPSGGSRALPAPRPRETVSAAPP